MKLKLKCTSCRSDFELKYKSITRPDLEDEIGNEYFRKSCMHCGTSKEYHVNDVKAEQGGGFNLIGTLAGIAIGAIITIMFWGRGYLSNVGLIIGGAIIAATNMSGSSNSEAFNKYYISRGPKSE